MMYEYEYGQAVRLTRNVRNDGTYPGLDIGHLLIRRGAVGYVRDVGLFLQDQIIYRVHFLEAGRTVGCREEELILATDHWVPNKYEFREKVYANQTMSANGEVIIQKGDVGEIESVIKEGKAVYYHARFHSRVFKVPEILLDSTLNVNG